MSTTNGTSGQGEQLLAITSISPWPGNPRKSFPEESLAELAESIKSLGMLQPVLVRPRPGLAGPGTSLYHLALGDGDPDAVEAAKKLEQHGIYTWAELGDKANRQVGYTSDKGIYAAVRGTPGVSAAEAKALCCVLKGPENGKVGEGFELADGERRWRAAKLAGLSEIPAKVRQLTDKEMLEIAIVSFEQREDLGPLEKAEGYRRMVEEHQVAVEDLAAKVGKSVSTIRGLLRLVKLPEKARQALDAGELSPSVAELIAARPSDAMRKKVADVALKKDWTGELPSYRQIRAVVERNFMVELKQAPFSQKDAELVPGAGACATCPKRTGNNREEFPDGRADVCTDPECYRAKVKAHQERLEAAAKAEGKTVLSKKETAKLFKSYDKDTLGYGAPYVDLDTTCFELPRKNATWRKLVGKQLASEVVLAYSETGTLHHLAPKAAALKVLRDEHGLKTQTRQASTSAGDARWKREQAERDAKAKAGKEAARRACEKVAKETGKAFNMLVGWTPAGQRILRALAAAVGEIIWNDACRVVARNHGQEGEPREAVARIAGANLKASESIALIAELVAAKKSLEWGGLWNSGQMDADEKAFWLTFGVDRAALVKEVLAEKAAKARGKAGANGKVKANGKPRANGKAPKVSAQVETDDERLETAFAAAADNDEVEDLGE